MAFTRNTLVIVVPTANPANIRSVYDLAKPGVKLDVAGPGVPVGSYTLQILKNMNLTAAVTKNVVSQETDVREVLAKVALGEADAGFVYSTDAKTVPGKVKVLKVPAWAQPKVQYGICVVSKSSDKADAQAFINKVLEQGRAGADARLRVPAPGQAEARREEALAPIDEAGGRHLSVRRDGRRHPGVSRVPDRGDLRPYVARQPRSTSSRTRSSRTRSWSA